MPANPLEVSTLGVNLAQELIKPLSPQGSFLFVGNCAIIKNMQIQIDNKLKDLVIKLAEKYGLRLLFLFGSQVTGQTHKESDFDFGYISSRDLSITDEGNLIIDLMPVARVRDERFINLVDFKKANPLLLYSALNDAQLLFENKSGFFSNLQAYSFKLFIETQPLYQLKAERLGINLK